MERYANISSDDVPKEKLRAANQAMIFCWSDLGIQNTFVLWFAAAGSGAGGMTAFEHIGDILGCVIGVADVIGVTDGFVRIRADASLHEIVRTVFHEARHVYQHKVCGGDPRGHGFDIEGDAWRYSVEAENAFRLWPNPSALTITNKEIR